VVLGDEQEGVYAGMQPTRINAPDEESGGFFSKLSKGIFGGKAECQICGGSGEVHTPGMEDDGLSWLPFGSAYFEYTEVLPTKVGGRRVTTRRGIWEVSLDDPAVWRGVQPTHPVSVGTVRLKEKWTSVRWRGPLQMRNKAEGGAEAPQATRPCSWYIGCYPAWSNQILPVVLCPDGSLQLHGAGPGFPLKCKPQPNDALLAAPEVVEFVAEEMVGGCDPFGSCKSAQGK